MAKTPDNNKHRSRSVLLGLGLDSDGHKRITTGENFLLAGGTKETHEIMTEKVIKMNEKMASRGKNLDTVSREEFTDIAHSVGMQELKPAKEASEEN